MPTGTCRTCGTWLHSDISRAFGQCGACRSGDEQAPSAQPRPEPERERKPAPAEPDEAVPLNQTT